MKWVISVLLLIPIIIFAAGLRVDVGLMIKKIQNKPTSLDLRTVQLKNGNRVVGELAQETSRSLTIKLDGATMTFKKEEIASSTPMDSSKLTPDQLVSYGLKKKEKPWYTFDRKDNLFLRLGKWDPVQEMSDDSWRATEQLKKNLGPTQTQSLIGQMHHAQAQIQRNKEKEMENMQGM